MYFTSTGDYTLFQQRENLGGGGTNFQIRTSVSQIGIEATGLTTLYSGANVYTAGVWMHVAVTDDGATTKIFFNGVQVASGANPALSASDQAYNIGAAVEASIIRYLSGRMQHVRLSNIARTSFPYVLATEPGLAYGTETTTQPSSSTFDAYAGCSDGILYKWDGVTTWTAVFDTRRLTWYDDITLKDADKVV